MNTNVNVVIVNCFDTYEHRVQLLKHYFVKRGLKVKVLTSDWRHFLKEVRQECAEEFELIHTKPYRRNLSCSRLISHYRFANDAVKRVEKYNPQLLWVLVPPNSLVKGIVKYKKNNPDVKIVFDLIDMWPETLPFSKSKLSFLFAFWKKLRNRYLKYADAVVTECDLYQSVLQSVCESEKMHTLYLAREYKEVHLAPQLPTDRINLCYLGSINNIIDIPSIVRIIRSFECKVGLHIIGDGEKRQELIDAAMDAGAVVVYHGNVFDREKKQAIFDQCHFGLNIMKESVFVGLTMKSMDYFEFGLPVINNIRGDTWGFVDSRKIGINFTEDIIISKEMIEAFNKKRNGVREFFVENFTEDIFEKRMDKITNRFNCMFIE